MAAPTANEDARAHHGRRSGGEQTRDGEHEENVKKTQDAGGDINPAQALLHLYLR